jgi:hypothetical protein
VPLAPAAPARMNSASVVADRPRQEPAAAGRPVEVGGARREPGNVGFLLRQDPGDDLGACAGLADRGSGRFESGVASGRADIGIPHQVDRAGRLTAVGRGRCGEAVADFSDGVAPACGHAEHHGEHMIAAAGFGGLAIRPPAGGRAKPAGRRWAAVGRGRRGVAVGVARQPARHAANRRLERGGEEKCHAGERSGRILVAGGEWLRQVVTKIDPPGKVAGIGDAVDLRREASGVDRREHGAQDLFAKHAARHGVVWPIPSDGQDVERRHLAKGDKRIGDGEAGSA